MIHKSIPSLVVLTLFGAMAAFAQGGGGSTYSGPPAIPLPAAQAQNPYAGSVPAGQATPEVLKLTFPDAVSRGLRQNLGALLANEDIGSARGEKWRQLSNLLPNVTTATSENVKQLDLKTFGFKFSVPGASVPAIVGPFGYFDTRAYLSQQIFSWEQINRTRSAAQNVNTAEYSYKNARDLVVQAVGSNYFLTIASAARVATSEAQVKTAQALYRQASDQLNAGVAASIDALRAKVELQTRQQQLIAARNDLAKQKLVLARVIGLPAGQQFEITEKGQYEPMTEITLEEALHRAYSARPDYQAALAQLRGAELARKAAVAEHYPTIDFAADYGDTGITPSHSHGTFDVAGVLRVPIFQGGKVHGDVLQTDASIAQSRAQLENLRGQIDQDVRTAFLDLQSAGDQVVVAQSNVDLASQTLTQAQDRFKAGVTDNIEVVQAQESVAGANESYIESLYSFNLAKISVARALGLAEENVKQFFKGY
ncbi:MAG: TolC family protein [Candidatus Acidiferrales bacterium]|jgi:outer membrane protein TolC